MAENTGKIISSGLTTFMRNPNIIFPFVINSFVTIFLGFIMAIAGFAGIFGSSISKFENLTPEESASLALSLMGQYIPEMIILMATIMIIIFFIQAYFISGAIGMAIQATESGNTHISTMRQAGRKHFFNMFMAEILFALLSLAGIVFIVPGAMKVNISQIFTSENPEQFAPIAAGLLLWGVYLLIMSIVLAVFRYALVSEGLGPLESMTASISFFRRNKRDVFLMFLIIFLISFSIMIIDQILANIPVVKYIWGLLDLLISMFVIPPLTTIWWVRLYLVNTGRKPYLDELLAHPNELNGS